MTLSIQVDTVNNAIDRRVDECERAARAFLLEVLRSVSFRRPAIPTIIALEADGFHVRLQTFQRETGESVTIDIRSTCPPILNSIDEALDWIYARVRDAWVHELNEALFVHGKRRRDLHHDDGALIPAPPIGAVP
jgi:hypothetical protein